MQRYTILPSMSPQEVVHAALHDLRAVSNKMRQPIRDIQRRHIKGDRKLVLEEIHPYTTPWGNKWMVVLRTSKAGVQVFHFVWYRGMDRRIRAVRISDIGTTHFHYSRHVFDQYNARFSPDVEAEDKLRQFLLANYECAVHVENPLADRPEVITGVRQGFIMGVWDDAGDIVHLTTFVDHGLFFPDQHILAEKLDFDRLLGSLTPGQRMHLLEKRRVQGEEGEARVA